MADSPGKKFALGIISKMGAKPPQEEAPAEEGGELRLCCEDLIDAVHAKDANAVEEALRDAFAVLEAEPHEEADEA